MGRLVDLDVVEDSTTGRLQFDSLLDPAYPEWTRAHIDVVLPEVVSNLGWTVIGPVFEQTHRTMLSRRLAVMRGSADRQWRHIARIGGYACINVTSARLVAARVPGVAPSKVDEEMGLLGLAPLGRKTWRDRAWHPLSVLGAVRAPVLLPFDLRRQRRLATQLSAVDVDDLTRTQLVEFIEGARRHLVGVLLAHYVARLFATPVMEKLQSWAPNAETALGLLADLDGLVSSEPALMLADLARKVRFTGQLDERDLDGFLSRYGHRGLSELDPGAEVWRDQRDRLRGRVLELARSGSPSTDVAGRRSEVREGAEATVAQLSWLRRTRLRQVAGLARRVSILGERSKDDVAAGIDAVRRALRALAAQYGLDSEDAALLSWAELKHAALTGEEVEVDLDQRRDERARAQASSSPLYWHAGNSTRVDYPTEATVLNGIAASPGEASGRAVIVRDPMAELPEAEILVAMSTDTAWTHLFLSHDAVVTETGDLLSHSSIVARDLGIPAVVGVAAATTAIQDGQTTHVDGTAGTVTVA